MSGKSYPEFQWTDDKIQLLLEATQNLKVEEDYKKITRFCPRPTVSYRSYVLMFLNSVVSFSKKTLSQLSFLVSLSESERSNPSPLRKSCRKKYMPMEAEGLSDMKTGTKP